MPTKISSDLRILFISVRADIGGGPKHVLDLKRTLQTLYPNLKLFLSCPTTGEYYPELREGLRGFVEIPFRSFNILAFFKLLLFCFRNDISIIHSHGRGAGAYSRLLGLFGFRVVHTFHGAYFFPSGTKRIKMFIERVLASLTNAFIAVSEGEADYVIEEKLSPPQKVSVVANGVDVERFSFHPRVVKNELTIGLLVRYHYQKGLDIFIQYIRDFYLRFPGLKIKCIIGGGGDSEIHDHLVKFIQQHNLSEKVLLADKQSDPASFYEKLDIYVSTSRAEGMPLVVLEVFASGIPCLLSNIFGHQQLAENGEAVLFNLESSEDFSQKLFSLVESSSLRSELAVKARASVEKKYSLEEMSRSTYAVYQKVIG